MKGFETLLKEAVSDYEGKSSELIHQAPYLYGLMVNLLDDSDLPKNLSPLVIASIAYFIIPEEKDVIPEQGPLGYRDDIFLCAFVADHVMEETGSEDILNRNWFGETPIIPLVRDILGREKDLIGEKKAQLMKYIAEE